MKQLEDALNAIDACTDTAGMLEVLRHIVGGLGYDGVSYIDTRRLADPGAEPFFQTTVRPDFATSYRDEGFIGHDPVAYRAARLNSPFTWADIPEFQEAQTPRRGVKSSSRRVMEAAFDHGFTQGHVLPVHAVDKSGRPAPALFSLFWTDRVDRLEQARPPWLRLVGLSYHERMLVLRGLGSTADEPMPMLTDRERDCLLWACRGKTTGETATILGIAERTVKFHMENSMGKLGVHNKFHAIAVAIQLGIIAP